VSYHVKRQGIGSALAAATFIAALALSGCASDAGFPAVHDMPAARTETTLTPDEVKQATDSLISQRTQLQSNAQPAAAANAPAAEPQQNAAVVPVKSTGSAGKATPAAQPSAADDATGATAIGAYAKP
jgi:hypothetical protein